MLLLVATLDTLPDPPANPCVAQSKLSSLHRSLEVIPPAPFVGTARQHPVDSLIAQSYVAPPYNGLGLLTGQVADLSPPVAASYFSAQKTAPSQSRLGPR